MVDRTDNKGEGKGEGGKGSKEWRTTHEDDLAGEGGNDGLGMHQGRVAQVVKPALVEDLGACLEPRGLLELHPVLHSTVHVVHPSKLVPPNQSRVTRCAVRA